MRLRNFPRQIPWWNPWCTSPSSGIDVQVHLREIPLFADKISPEMCVYHSIACYFMLCSSNPPWIFSNFENVKTPSASITRWLKDLVKEKVIPNKTYNGTSLRIGSVNEIANNRKCELIHGVPLERLRLLKCILLVQMPFALIFSEGRRHLCSLDPDRKVTRMLPDILEEQDPCLMRCIDWIGWFV